MVSGKVIGATIAIIAVVAIAFILFQYQGRSIFQAATNPVETQGKPETSSLQQQTTINKVTETVPMQTRVHLLSDTYTVQSGSDKIITYTTGPASAAYVIGNATVTGGGSVQLLVLNEDGKCPGLLCDQKLVRSSENVQSWLVEENRNIKLKVFTGSKQQLVFTTTSTNPQKITFNLDILYEETVTRPAFDAVANIPNLDSQSITASIQSSLNDSRATISSPALTWNPILSQVAQRQSEYLSQSRAISIYDAENKSPTSRATENGYNCNTVHNDGLNHLINEISLKIDTRDGYETNEQIANYATSYLFDSGAKIKFNSQAGIGTAVDNTGVVWITFDGC